MNIKYSLVLAIGILFGIAPANAESNALKTDESAPRLPGFLVVAPDRGFLGNEELHDAFTPLAKTTVAELVFVTDERTRDMLQSAVDRLQSAGAQRIVLLPFFISSAHPKYQMMLEMLEQCPSKNPGKWRKAACDSGRTVVLPFHQGRKLDSMMSLNAQLWRALRDRAEVMAGHDLTPHSHVTTWLLREANRFSAIRKQDLGIVFLAHGSDYHWNESMRQAVMPLMDRYKIEFAFSMADPPIIERAVRCLENRGARAIVILRVFGLADSFQATVERLIGLDIEGGAEHQSHTGRCKRRAKRSRGSRPMAGTATRVPAAGLFRRLCWPRWVALRIAHSLRPRWLTEQGHCRLLQNERRLF